MNLFTSKELQDFIRMVNCMSDMEFYEMYRTVFGDGITKSYTNEKLRQCRTSFIHWICELDSNTLYKFMSNCLDR